MDSPSISVRFFAVFAAVFAVIAGVGWTQGLELRSGYYEVAPGTVIEMEGGYFGETYEMEFSGNVQLEVDSAGGTGRILESDLWVFSAELGSDPIQFPTFGDLPLEELEGALLDDATLELVSPAGGSYPFQTVALVLTATAEGMTLNGFYDEGCCDRYVLTFVDASLRLLPGPSATAVPSIGLLGSTFLILIVGMAGAVLARRLF